MAFKKFLRKADSAAKTEGKKRKKIPTIAEVKAIRRKFFSDPALDRHVETVRLFAVAVAEAAVKAGFDVNPKMVDRMARLHDLVLVYGRKSGRKWQEVGKTSSYEHARYAAQVLARKGYHEIARAIGKHGYPIGARTARKYFSIEEKILALADTRALGDTLPGWQKKIDRDKKAYPVAGPQHRSMQQFAKQLERKGVDIEKIIKSVRAKKGARG
ncbi:MAG: HD domain-containing protein [archaeon]|jgi:hypothetical protein|nr:HD domain-containing protein [archaeon]